jgi:hemoglobin-like flavoprotein
MTQKQIELIKSTWAMVAKMDPEVVGQLFYNRLFEIAPPVKHLFRNPVPEQSRKLIAMLNYVISKLDKLNDIMEEVSQLAQRHVRYGVNAGHFVIVGETLLWTLEKGLGEAWNDEVKEAWTVCYTILSSAMINAMKMTAEHAA